MYFKKVLKPCRRCMEFLYDVCLVLRILNAAVQSRERCGCNLSQFCIRARRSVGGLVSEVSTIWSFIHLFCFQNHCAERASTIGMRPAATPMPIAAGLETHLLLSLVSESAVVAVQSDSSVAILAAPSVLQHDLSSFPQQKVEVFQSHGVRNSMLDTLAPAHL